MEESNSLLDKSTHRQTANKFSSLHEPYGRLNLLKIPLKGSRYKRLDLKNVD